MNQAPVASESDSVARGGRRRVLFLALCVLGIPPALSGLDHLVGRLVPQPARHLLFPSGSRITHESSEFDVNVAISTQGLRDRAFPPTPKNPGRRIVAIGDSFTFGWGVSAQESWPKVLEQRLADSGPGFEVINFGFPGASPNDYSRMITSAIDHFHPDVILIATLQGDDLVQLVEQEPDEVPWAQRLRDATFPTLAGWLRPVPGAMESYRSVFLKSQSYLRSTLTPEQQRQYEQLSDRVRAAFEGGMLNPSLVHAALTHPARFLQPVRGGTEWQAQAESKWRRCVREWLSACRQTGTELVVLVVPDGPYVSRAALEGMREVGYEVPDSLLTINACQAIVLDICRELGVEVINPVAEFRRVNGEHDYFRLDGHFTPRGHLRLGTAVAREIRPGGPDRPPVQ